MASPTLAARPTAVIPKPELHASGKACLVVLALLGAGALGGAAFLVSDPSGKSMQWTLDMLAGSPFPDFFVPGLILGGLFGIGSFIVVGLGLVRHPIAPFLAFAIGVAQMIWITVELAIIGEFSFLHPACFALGLVIAATAVRWGWPTFQAWRANR